MLIISKCTCTLALVMHSFPLTHSAQCFLHLHTFIHHLPLYNSMLLLHELNVLLRLSDHSCTSLFPKMICLMYPYSTIYKAQVVLHQHQTRKGLIFKGRVPFLSFCFLAWRKSSPTNKNSVINYSPSCRSKPARPSSIFRTQIKIFLMQSKSSLTLKKFN